MIEKPLVSVIIPNYNYGRYLTNCFDSVLNQTYDNLEVIFRDNNSSDESLRIAMEYYEKFKRKGIYFCIHNNKYNIGSSKNTEKALDDGNGDFTYVLASDDSIEPEFIERCVNVFIKNPNVSMVITHRYDVDENGKKKSTLPFYNKNCIIPGEEQAAVFMMAGIAIPGQRMGRSSGIQKIRSFKRNWNVAGDWYDNFLYSCCGDVAYIMDPLCNYRVHSGNETSESEDNLMGSFEHYQLIHSFMSIADAFEMTKPQQRYSEAIKKLGSMCLRYCKKMLDNSKWEIADRYLHLAIVYDEKINKTREYIELQHILDIAEIQLRKNAIYEYEKNYCLERAQSYNPPNGYVEIDSCGEKI